MQKAKESSILVSTQPIHFSIPISEEFKVHVNGVWWLIIVILSLKLLKLSFFATVWESDRVYTIENC